MLGALISIFALVVTWLLSFLPEGPDFPSTVADMIQGAIGFIKALDLIVPVDVELAAITAIIVWQIAKAGFRGAAWAYKRIIK